VEGTLLQDHKEKKTGGGKKRVKNLLQRGDSRSLGAKEALAQGPFQLKKEKRAIQHNYNQVLVHNKKKKKKSDFGVS